MAEKNKKNLKISEMLVNDELRPIECMLAEYRLEMENMKKALRGTTPAKNKTVKKQSKKK